MTCKAIVLWQFHDLVSLLREMAGYKDYTADPNLDEGQIWLDYVTSLDPKDWKEHDFYAILGLKKLRYRATDAQIKNAYRRLILEHHPDKNPAMHVVFICIQKAYTWLNDPDKRKAYDSVDPSNNDEIPSAEDVKNKDFYNVFSTVFYNNSKWSRRQPVPQLGSDNSPIESVNQFYRFWYDFDSWREFSFLDNEVTEEGANREERRYVEKINKAERAERRKEEMRRIRQLVDLAHANDPRLKRYIQQQKDAKLQKKQERQAAIKKLREAEEEQRRAEQQRLEAERLQAEAESKRLAEEKKRERELVKNRLKRERKQLRAIMQNPLDFFCHQSLSAADTAQGDTAKGGAKESQKQKGMEDRRVLHMHHVDLICNNLEAEEMEQLNSQLSDASLSLHAKYQAFLSCVQKIQTSLEQEKNEALRQQNAASTNKTSASGSAADAKWTVEMNQCLVKGVNSIPAGSVNRWDAVAQYIMTHVASCPEITGKDVLKRVNAMKQNDNKLKSEAQQQAQSNLLQSQNLAEAVKNVKITERSDVADGVKPWSAEEQKRLEEALRKIPASEPDRWDKISDFMGDRTKKECMLRYKTVVEMLKSKKASTATK